LVDLNQWQASSDGHLTSERRLASGSISDDYNPAHSILGVVSLVSLPQYLPKQPARPQRSFASI
jgi:hypothetical protein